MLDRGMTLIEIIVASVIGLLIAGGALMVFVTATRISGRSSTDAPFVAQQTLEAFRNLIACEDQTWFDPSNCTATSLPAPWTPHTPLPGGTKATARDYQVTAVDCDGVGGPGDCFQVQVKVTY